MKNVIYCLFLIVSSSFIQTIRCQPYYDTHVVNKYVAENVFIKSIADTTTPPAFKDIMDKLPQPMWIVRQDVINCYWKTWQLAFHNLHKAPVKSGFVSPFIDPAFNGHIFMWDSGFMLMFGRYGSRVFNFQNTLNNFYAKQHKDGFICREIVEADGRDLFERFDVSSTGPNILPWTEWEYFLNFNDTNRLKQVFPPLLAYYQWYKTYRTWQDGTYFSSGWGCGMDNQPRMSKEFFVAWSHGNMSWIDITLQEIFAGKVLINISKRLKRTNDVKEIENEITYLTDLVNKTMWDDKTAFYYDKYKDGKISNVKSIASYWALLAGVVPEKNLKKFVSHLENTDEFARFHRVATLSADNPNFKPEGGYWLGSVWAPTNYMVLRGLTNYKQDSLAFQIAWNHLDNVVKVFNQTATVFENYAPDKLQGNDTPDFVGWTGLTPISILFEYVFGIRPDVPNNTIVWDIRLTDEFGVKQYPFGNKGLIDFYCPKRSNPKQQPAIKINSNLAFKLKLIWNGGSKTIEVKPKSG